MSWLFSQALVAEYSAATCSAGAPSAPLSVMPTQQGFWRNDRMMEPSKLSQFGPTCAVLTEGLGLGLLTWFLADSRVRTYQLPGMAPASMAHAQAFGERWHESSVRYDLGSSSWRTHRCLWDEALPWSSVTLPNWGMTRAGVLWEPPTLGRPISATGSGLWPTPTVCGNYNQPGASKNAGWGLASAVKQWTTPSASDGRRGGKITAAMTGTSLAQQVNTPERWPTPTASLADKGGRITPRNGREGGTLIEAVSARTWPTPVASMAKGSSPASLTRKSGKDRSNDRLDHAVMASDGGQLNPVWVEWLMGWPTGWTGLKPLEMAKFREWQQQHSLICHKAGSDAA